MRPDRMMSAQEQDRKFLHDRGPRGFEPCTREWPHDGPCAHRRTTDQDRRRRLRAATGPQKESRMTSKRPKALSPAQAREIREATNVDDLIDRINGYLSTTPPSADGGWYWSTAGTTAHQQVAVVKHYIDAGWGVSTGSDRDGNYLKFTETP